MVEFEVKKIRADNKPEAFNSWLEKLVNDGYTYEVVIQKGMINHVYVRKADDGNWDFKFGRAVGGRDIKYKERVFSPVLLNGKFIDNYDQR